MKGFRKALAIWLCPDLAKTEHDYHCIMYHLIETRAWLSEFPDVFAATTRLLELMRHRHDETAKVNYPTSMWDFREGLRKAKSPDPMPGW